MVRTGDTAAKAIRDEGEAARAAWLHFVGGLTQSEVAKRLSIPTTRAHRHIARAQADGLVRVFVDVQSAECVALETALMNAYGLSMCRVAMDVPETGPMPLRGLSAVGADYLMQVVTGGAHEIIGVSNGRTLCSSVAAMARVDARSVRFVSMLGGLTRSFAANPYDVIHGLGQKTAGDAYLMPVPLYADSADDKRTMMKQTGLAATMDLIDRASLVIVGIGNLDVLGGTALAMVLNSTEEIAPLRQGGATAEILGQFIDADGTIMATPYDDRVMAPALETLRGREIVAIAGGAQKSDAITAALRSGLLTGLIVDETTAQGLASVLPAKHVAAE